MHNIRYRINTATYINNELVQGFKVFIEPFTSKEKAAEWLKHPPIGATGFDYWYEPI